MTRQIACGGPGFAHPQSRTPPRPTNGTGHEKIGRWREWKREGRESESLARAQDTESDDSFGRMHHRTLALLDSTGMTIRNQSCIW